MSPVLKSFPSVDQILFWKGLCWVEVKVLLLVTLGPGAVPGSGPAHGRGGGVETEVVVG